MTSPSPRPATLRTRARRTARATAAALGVAVGRTRLGVLQAVAPHAADRVALALWCDLPAARRRPADRRPGPGEVHRIPLPRGGDAVAEVWGEGPTVLLVHGWGGWRGQLGAFVEPLVAAGFRVVAVDAPGHGDASAGFMGPGRGTLVELTDAVVAADATLGPTDAVVAHSLGCTAALVAIEDGVPARAVVLVAPNPGLEPLLGYFSRVLGLRARARDHLRGELERLLERSIADVDAVRLAQRLGDRDEPASALVVHDRGDRTTAHEAGEAVAAAWPGTRLLSTEGLGHERILAAPPVLEAVTAHVMAAVSSRP